MENVELKILDSVNDIKKSEWDALFGDIPEGHGFYKTLEESNLEDYSFCYAGLYRNGEAVLVAPLFVGDLDLGITVTGPISGIIGGIRKVFPRFLKVKTLFCGSPFGENGILGFAGGLGNDEKKALIRALENAMDGYCRGKKIPMMVFKDHDGAFDAALSGALRSAGFFMVDSMPSAGMKIDFSSLEEYLKKLSGSTRKDLRRKIRNSEKGDVKIKVVDNVEDTIDEVYRLYLNTYEKGQMKFEKLSRDFFLNIARNLNPEVRFFLYYCDGALSAFNLCFVHKDIFIDKFIGFDYGLSRKYGLYSLSWCRNIEWCLANGVKYYQVGQTDYAPKETLGGELTPLYAYVKHRNVVYNSFLKTLAGILKL